jgi:hypothetical protein
MPSKYFGVSTKSGSWFLLEDQSHLLKNHSWHLITRDERLAVSVLVSRRYLANEGVHLLNALSGLSSMAKDSGISMGKWAVVNFGKGKNILPGSAIRSVEEFNDYYIVCAGKVISHFYDLAGIDKSFKCNTSLVTGFISFK